MKRILALALALCLLCSAAALAESTTLKTQVPYTHAVTIVCGERGHVRIDGKKYKGTFTLDVPRLGDLVIATDPYAGYDLAQITVADMDGVSIEGDWVALRSVHDENTLTFRFYELPKQQKPAGSGTAGNNGGAAQEILPAPEAVEPFVPMPPVEQPVLGEATLADAAVIPWLTPTGNDLYDGYLGTGAGLRQTSVVFDGEYQPEDYELLNVLIDDETQGNSALVCAMPGETGETERRSMIVSAAQLVKLAQKQKTEHIIFENGSAIVEMDMTDLVGGELAALMGLVLSGETVTQETMETALEDAPMVSIPAAELAAADLEVRVVPVLNEQGVEMHEVSVWLRVAGQELNVSALIPSLTVAIAVDDLVSEENFETFASQYVVCYQPADGDGEIVRLPRCAAADAGRAAGASGRRRRPLSGI